MGRLKVVGCKANCKGSDKPRPIDKRRKTIAANMYHRQGTMQHCLNKLWATSPLSQSLKRAIQSHLFLDPTHSQTHKAHKKQFCRIFIGNLEGHSCYIRKCVLPHSIRPTLDQALVR